MYLIQFGTRRISYRLYRTDGKRFRIAVSPDLTVNVYAPKTVNNRQVRKAVLKKAPWIARTLTKVESYHPLPTEKKYISGETFVYLGRQYRLKVIKGTKLPAKLEGRFLRVWVEDNNGGKKAGRAVKIWYREHAREIFQRYIKNCYKIASRHGVPEPLFSLRTMRRRWGSCSSAGRITLNVKLVQTPVHCIEYVIMHELCHLKIHNHSRKYYSLLNRCMPDWRRRKKALDRFMIY